MEVGGLRVASITDRIDGPSNWTIQRDVHALILYEAGGYHWLETWLGDMRTSLGDPLPGEMRSEEHTSELQSLMRISYAVFCLKKKKMHNAPHHNITRSNSTNLIYNIITSTLL